MNNKLFKKLVTTISFLVLFGNATPIFAQLVELQILGGGYKLRGPSTINFPARSTGTSSSTNTINFSDIQAEADEEPANYLKIIDENGGNPFDVTVTTSELKRDEFLETQTIADSLNTHLKVTDTSGFAAGDTILLPEFDSSKIYTIANVLDTNTLNLTENFLNDLPPAAGETVTRVVDCEISPRRCISLSGFSIRNGSQVDTVNGDIDDFQTNTETDDFVPFMGATTTIAGSSGVTLKVEDSSVFFNDEEISFDDDTGVSPETNTILSIVDANTITLQSPFTSAPGPSIEVQSSNIRNLTLGNGTGASPGEWNITPVLQDVIDAGQLPGQYRGTLNFTIV